MEIKWIRFVLIIPFVLGFTSCLKEEIAVEKSKPGDQQLTTISLESNYRNQLYFDLERNEIVTQNEKLDWDLGFTTGAEQYQITLNTSKLMAVKKVEATNLSDVLDTNSGTWSYDVSTGHLDSTAFGDWREGDYVYVIDRGVNLKGRRIGFAKIKILSVSEDSFTIEYAELEDKLSQTATIFKDTRFNISQWTFEDGGEVVLLQPSNRDWDMVFTHYTYYFKKEDVPYLVSGALLNAQDTRALMTEEYSYEEVDREIAESLAMSQNLDRIGYDWKVYDLDEGAYTVFPEMIYIVRTQEGFYYKLRFLDFYNSTGESGFPTFEFQRL